MVGEKLRSGGPAAHRDLTPWIVALVLPENRASARVIQKLGMTPIGNRRFKNLDVAVYERLAPHKEPR